MYRGIVGAEQLSHAARTIRGIGHVFFSTRSQIFYWQDQVVTLGESPVQVSIRFLYPLPLPPRSRPCPKQQQQQQQRQARPVCVTLLAWSFVEAQWSTLSLHATTNMVQRGDAVSVVFGCTCGASSSRCKWPWQQPFITAVMLGPYRTTLY